MARAAHAARLGDSTFMGDRPTPELIELRTNVVQLGRASILDQLASALAHEPNQPLGAILRNMDVAELDLQSEEPDLDGLAPRGLGLYALKPCEPGLALPSGSPRALVRQSWP